MLGIFTLGLAESLIVSFHVHSGMFLSHANKLKCGINIYARTLLVVQLAQALLCPPVKIKQMFRLDQEGVGVGGMRRIYYSAFLSVLCIWHIKRVLFI